MAFAQGEVAKIMELHKKGVSFGGIALRVGLADSVEGRARIRRIIKRETDRALVAAAKAGAEEGAKKAKLPRWVNDALKGAEKHVHGVMCESGFCPEEKT